MEDMCFRALDETTGTQTWAWRGQRAAGQVQIGASRRSRPGKYVLQVYEVQ